MYPNIREEMSFFWTEGKMSTVSHLIFMLSSLSFSLSFFLSLFLSFLCVLIETTQSDSHNAHMKEKTEQIKVFLWPQFLLLRPHDVQFEI